MNKNLLMRIFSQIDISDIRAIWFKQEVTELLFGQTDQRSTVSQQLKILGLNMQFHRGPNDCAMGILVDKTHYIETASGEIKMFGNWQECTERARPGERVCVCA